MDIDIWEVIEAAKTKPFGFMPFYPGPGLGGHCIPIDPFYLTWKARQFDQHSRFIELAGEINTAMPDYVVKTSFEALNHEGKAIKGSKILLLGLAYKANIDDDRESPTYKLIQKFEALGGAVSYHDPFVPVIPMTREHANYAGRKSEPNITGDFDLIVLTTGHDSYKEHDFSLYEIPLVDTRNTVPLHHRPSKYYKA
jgi:UDP-N-acetyl-D-glucosamine dehydrogenase